MKTNILIIKIILGFFITISALFNNLYAQNEDFDLQLLGFGTNFTINDMVINSKSEVIIGGDFSSTNGQNNKKYCAKWVGNTWEPFHIGFDKKIELMAIDKNDKIYFYGDFNKVNEKKVKSIYCTPEDSNILDKDLGDDVAAMTTDKYGNFYAIGLHNPMIGKSHHYLYTYDSHSSDWEPKVEVTTENGDRISTESDRKMDIIIANEDVVFVSISDIGILKYSDERWTNLHLMSKSERDTYKRKISNVSYDPATGNIYFTEYTKDKSFRGTVICMIDKDGKRIILTPYDHNLSPPINAVLNVITVDYERSIMYLGGTSSKGQRQTNTFNTFGDFLFQYDLKSKIINNISDYKVDKGGGLWPYVQGEYDDYHSINALALDKFGNLFLAGRFTGVTPDIPAQNIAKLNVNEPPSVFRTDMMRIGPKNHRMVPNTVFTVEGAVSISSSDPATPKLMNKKYIDNYLLWVEKGIVADDIAFADPKDWSDYVFDDDYELMDLEKLRKYIEENGHLPGIPSEKEIIKDGYSVLEMNKKFMAKIEELVLYTIQLEEQLESEKEMNKRIEQEISEIRKWMQSHTVINKDKN